MTFDEWNEDQTGLFSKLWGMMDTTNFPDLETEPGDWDSTFSFLYGSRMIPKKMENLTVDEVAKMLYTMYRHKWQESYKLLYDEIVRGTSSTVTRNTDKKRDTNRIMGKTNTSNTSAYNDSEYVPDTENDEELTDENIEGETGTDTTETKSLWAVRQQLSILESDFINVIMRDVQNQTTLSIY